MPLRKLFPFSKPCLKIFPLSSSDKGASSFNTLVPAPAMCLMDYAKYYKQQYEGIASNPGRILT